MYLKIKAAVKAKNKSTYGQIILIPWLKFVICVWKKGNDDMNMCELFFLVGGDWNIYNTSNFKHLRLWEIKQRAPKDKLNGQKNILKSGDKIASLSEGILC
jgi:hypothetical protein